MLYLAPALHDVPYQEEQAESGSLPYQEEQAESGSLPEIPGCVAGIYKEHIEQEKQQQCWERCILGGVVRFQALTQCIPWQGVGIYISWV